MDFISDKVKIVFDYHLNVESNIDFKLIKSRDRKLLVDIEGTLKIVILGKIFFEENDVLLMEFAVTLLKWKNKLDNGYSEDFKYISMSYTEEALLMFTDQGNGFWQIASPWQKFVLCTPFSQQELMLAINIFLDDISLLLKEKYDIDLMNFT